MKNLIIIVCVLLAAAGLCFYGFNFNSGNVGDAIGANITNGATTTTSLAVPVKVLNTNGSRRYALITNDSDTVVYLYLGYFASPKAASTTVALNTGVRLAASGGSFEIDPDNLYTGQVWATSTAASKKLIYVEK
jgi:hypothetical protein